MKNGGHGRTWVTGVHAPTNSDRAVIFDIQRFSLHDGPGIRTTVFFKGCPLRCAWCQNPESQARRPEIAFYAERCRGCFRCRSSCPAGAILDGKDRRVDYARCNACGACARACPADALRLIGSLPDPESLAADILKDRDFFADSGGGLTLSGGEPMIYPGYVLRLLRLMHDARIHTAIETCGVFRIADMKDLLPYLDLVYFDLKHMDPGKHREYTGADNRAILSNFSGLSKAFRRLQARMPVVPGFNDDGKNIRATARFLSGTGRRSIHCLPYHNLGESKLARLHTAQRPLGLTPPDREAMVQVKKIFKQEGINAIIYE